ncbi:dual specificity protein phosphatase 18 [Corythoichthys intestinalis]|uniref:dual specificity protein phosphatase 18 n=1 Tax=Corythoichthys intestinalis TaxID=161448 RepID=UPI0025A5E208|nr:dual specificity protein phosphatase 18 [Corythoichthys intestinalis]
MSFCEITPTLFLGGADAALNGILLARKGVTLIVNATLSHSCPLYPGVEILHVPVRDLPGARLGDHFEPVGRRIHGNRAGATLVHCAAGKSRSPALVLAYLMRYHGLTLCQAHRRVRNVRPCVSINAGFWEQLLIYEKRLYGRNTVTVEPELSYKAVDDSPSMTSRHGILGRPFVASRYKLAEKSLSGYRK